MAAIAIYRIAPYLRVARARRVFARTEANIVRTCKFHIPSQLINGEPRAGQFVLDSDVVGDAFMFFLCSNHSCKMNEL